VVIANPAQEAAWLGKKAMAGWAGAEWQVSDTFSYAGSDAKTSRGGLRLPPQSVALLRAQA
jgi:hypothetical protein